MLRHCPEPGPQITEYDPAMDLPQNHPARWAEKVVEQSVQVERGARRAVLGECLCALPGMGEAPGLSRPIPVVLDSTKVRA